MQSARTIDLLIYLLISCLSSFFMAIGQKASKFTFGELIECQGYYTNNCWLLLFTVTWRPFLGSNRVYFLQLVPLPAKLPGTAQAAEYCRMLNENLPGWRCTPQRLLNLFCCSMLPSLLFRGYIGCVS